MLTLLKPWSWTPTCVRCGAITRDGPLAAELEIALVAGGVEVQQRRAVLKALRPLGPALGRVAALDGEHGRRRAGRAALLDRVDALGRPRPEALQLAAADRCGVSLRSRLITCSPKIHHGDTECTENAWISRMTGAELANLSFSISALLQSPAPCLCVSVVTSVYRLMRAEPPPAMWSSSSSVIWLVSPRVLISSAPWATPRFDAFLRRLGR